MTMFSRSDYWLGCAYEGTPCKTMFGPHCDPAELIAMAMSAGWTFWVLGCTLGPVQIPYISRAFIDQGKGLRVYCPQHDPSRVPVGDDEGKPVGRRHPPAS